MKIVVAASGLRLCSRDGCTTMAIFMGVLDAASEDYRKIVTTAALVVSAHVKVKKFGQRPVGARGGI
jgi:hypothetical protein